MGDKYYEYYGRLRAAQLQKEKIEKVINLITSCTECPFESLCSREYPEENRCLLNQISTTLKDDIEYYQSQINGKGAKR